VSTHLNLVDQASLHSTYPNQWRARAKIHDFKSGIN
jgi:hypothetical protein